MSQPIDIKTKKIIPENKNIKFDKSFVLDSLEQNILTHWDTWGKFQQAWVNRAYRTFNDLEKYIVMIYLIRNYWQKLADKFTYLSMDEFYDLDDVTIDKINLIQISNDLNIPKETIRRKVNELQHSNILFRSGKSITFNKKGIDFQKPEATIDLLKSEDESSSLFKATSLAGLPGVLAFDGKIYKLLFSFCITLLGSFPKADLISEIEKIFS